MQVGGVGTTESLKEGRPGILSIYKAQAVGCSPCIRDRGAGVGELLAEMLEGRHVPSLYTKRDARREGHSGTLEGDWEGKGTFLCPAADHRFSAGFFLKL